MTLQSVEKWHTDAKKPLDDLVMEGKQLANNGRMELQMHEVLSRLDEVIDLSAKVIQLNPICKNHLF